MTHQGRQRRTRWYWKTRRARLFRVFVGYFIIRECPLQSRCRFIDRVLPHQSEFSIYKATEAKWVDILALAQRWTFKEIEQLCIRELEKLPIAPIDKIQTYQAFHIDRTLLAESFAKLTIRPEPINLEEGRKLGIETSLQIAQAREAARGMNPNRQVNDTELRSVIQNVFGLEESVDFLVQ